MQPEQKIAQLQAAIGQLEQRSNTLLQAKDALENRSVTGVQVQHSSFGDGQVVSQDGKRFTVAFSDGQKQFLFPDAFRQSYLRTPDAALQADLEKYRLVEDRLSTVQQNIRTAQQHIEKLQRK